MRQRRVVQPLLNERIMNLVWLESCKQATNMVKSFTENEIKGPGSNVRRGETDAMVDGVRGVAIGVLGSVAYGAEVFPQGESNEAPPGYHLSYMKCILAIVNNLVPAACISAKLLTSPVMPGAVRDIGYAVIDFPRHVASLLAMERELTLTKTNLMSTLVKASDAGKADTSASSDNKLFLSEREICGNLFQFTVAGMIDAPGSGRKKFFICAKLTSVAGFDTTANTMAYAIVHLAIYPQWQDWIREEYDTTPLPDQELSYNQTYPRMKRTLALLVRILNCVLDSQ